MVSKSPADGWRHLNGAPN